MNVDKILIKLGTNNSSQIATAVLAGFKMIFLPIATMTDKSATPDQKKYTIVRDLIMEGLALVTYIGVTGQIQKHASAPIAAAYFKNIAKKIEKKQALPRDKWPDKYVKLIENATQEDINVLKNFDYKKLKEAGENYLDPKKTITQDTKDYIERIKNIVSRLNGESASAEEKTAYETFVKKLVPRDKHPKMELISNDLEKASKSTLEILNPLKAFHNTRIALSQLSVWTLALIVIPPMCNAIIAPIMKSLDKKLAEKQQNNIADKQPVFTGKQEVRNKTFNNFYNYFPNSTGMRV